MPESRTIPIALIDEPVPAVRYEMDEEKMQELMASIRTVGLINPLCVEENGPRFRVRAGHRRLLAMRGLGTVEAPCRVYKPGEASDLQIKLHENAYREDVSPAEEGWTYAELASQEGMTEEALARMCGQSIGYIYSRLELVKGDNEVVMAVHRREINLAVSRELAKCGDEPHRRYLLNLARDQGATARVVMSWVMQWKASQGLLPPAPPASDQPAFVATVQNTPIECALCGQGSRPWDLESVFICRNELRAIKSSLAAADKQEVSQ
jgi:ParB family chromosome partitioning protein